MTPLNVAPTRRRIGRSVLAVLAGLAAIFALSMLMDQVMYALGVFPRPPRVTYETVPYVVAVLYRGAIGVAGCWLAGRLAPDRPMRHALILGGVGVVLSLGGVAAALAADLGPLWYPLALVIVTPACAWLGGQLAEGQRA